MPHNQRSDSFEEKQAAKQWLDGHPGPAEEFHKVLACLAPRYLDENHGYIDIEDSVQYRMGGKRGTTCYVIIVGQVNQVKVEVSLDNSTEVKKYKIRPGQEGDADLREVIDYLRANNVSNFDTRTEMEVVARGWPDLAPPLLANAAIEEINADPQCKDEPETFRLALARARIGQGSYRLGMMKFWGGRCALTGCAVQTVLIASHAKAWAESSNKERVDKFNGLLLAAHVDRLFDGGLVSFADDGRIMSSPYLPEDALEVLGLSSQTRLQRMLDERHLPYLQAHRLKYGYA